MLVLFRLYTCETRIIIIIIIIIIIRGWVRARLSFAILRAALLCVRGSRTKWRSLGIVDGASLPITAAD